MTIDTIINTLRHAHTQYNAEKRYAGTIDIPLSEIGVREAHNAARTLASVKFDIVITSTLKRTYETAIILVGNRVPIIQNMLCNERNFGVMEGLTWDDIQMLQPPILLINVGNDLHTVNPEGGEPFEEVWERAKKFHRLLLHEYEGANILVVSHGVFLQMYHGYITGLSCIESLATYPANLELTRFHFSGKNLTDSSITKLISDKTIAW